MPTDGTSQMVLEGSNPVSSAGCVGGTFAGADGDTTLTWTGGTVEAGIGLDPGVCTIEFQARLPANAPTGLSFANGIGAGDVTGDGIGGGVTNPDPSPVANVASVDSVAVSKSFSPSNIAQTGESTLTIRIRNRVVAPITDVDLTDNLPAGLTLAANPAVTNSCGGTLQAFPNTDQLILTGGAIVARPDDEESADCVITARVTGAAVGSYENIINPADFSTSVGSIPAAVSATLDIDTGLTGSKGFTPSTTAAGGRSRVKVTLRNPSSGTLTNVSVTDPLGTGLTVANPANASSNCPGSPTLVADPGAASAELLGATLQAGGSCDFFFDVVTSGSGPWVNTIPAGNITSAEGPTSTEAVTATLTESTAELRVNKSFDPVIVTGGLPSLLRIDLVNPSAITMQGVELTDVFPFGIEVYSVPDASTTCPGGHVTAIPGDNKVVLTGAGMLPNQTCQIFVTTTSVSFLNLTNGIAEGAVITDQGYTNPEPTVATLSTLQGLGITKGFTPDSIGPGEVSRLSLRLISTLNPNAVVSRELTGVSYTDTLPDGMFIAAAPNESTDCAGTGTGGTATIATSNDAARGQITVTDATIPPGSNCTVEVDVRVDDLGAYANEILARDVTSEEGVVNEEGAEATLNVSNSPTVAKAFANPDRDPGEPNPLTVTITNPDPNLELTGVALTDSLPAGLAIADPANAATTCSDGQVAASPGEGSLSLSDATIAPSSSCTFSANVVGNDTGEYINFIDIGELTNDQGTTNPASAQSTMSVGAPASVAKAFNPVGIAPGAVSQLTITLSNGNSDPVALTQPLIDALPGELFVAAPPNAGTTCVGGVVDASAGGTTVTLAAGAEIPGAGDCTITVDVTASVEQLYTNVIAAGQLQTASGSNQAPVSASLAVSATNPLVPGSVDKAFSPGTILAGDPATLTLTLGNLNPSPLTLAADFVDTLPSGVVVANPANIGGTCTGSVTAPAGGDSITYPSNAQIPAGGCTITVSVTSATGGSYTNTVPAGALVTDGGASLDPANAGLVVEVPTPPTAQKAFSPTTINPGDVSRLTISLGNANDGDITLSADLVDNLPAGVTVADPADLVDTCPGSVSATPGGNTITYPSGATIPSGGCTIAVDVTASDSDASPFVNTIPAGDLQTSAGNNGADATANLFVNAPQPPSLNKYFVPSGIIVGGTSTLTLSFGNDNLTAGALTAILVDTLPSGVVVADPPNIQASSGCDAGDVGAVAGGSTVTVASGATIPIGGCSVSVDVTSDVESQTGHLNSIEAGALQTDLGDNIVGTSARLKVSPLGITKEVDGSTGPLAIGDEVAYTVSITVPGGLDGANPFVVQDLTLTDALPDGLEYLVGTYTLTQDPNLDFNGTLPSDFTVNGNDLTANLGEVSNTSGAEQTFTIGYTLRIKDIPSSVAGTDLINTATVSSSDTESEWDDDATVTVGEPVLGIVKAMSPDTDLETGDVVTVTLTVTNTGDVPAYDVVATDVLNDGTDNDLFALAAAGINDTSTGTGADDFDFAYVEGTGTITYTAQNGVSLAANGGQVIFTFTATVGPDIRTGWTYSNVASTIGNSQDGGTNGRETVEVDSNTATVNTGIAAVSKVIDASSEAWTTDPQVAIGEVITYRLSYTIPVGETVSPGDAAIFADTLPAGQQFQSGTATIEASAAGVTIADGTQVTGVADGGALPTSPTAIAPTVAAQDLGFDVGTVQNTGTADAQVIIRFDALVLNTADNNHNDSKTNTATLNYVNRDGTPQSLTDTQQTTIVEPLPATAKSVSPTTAAGNDTVTFTVVASAATGSNRTRLWDAIVTDTLPARYLSPSLTSAVLSRGSVDVSTCGSFAGQTLTLSMDCGVLADAERYLGPGQNITLTYEATLDPAIDFEETVTNTAELQGTSLPGSNGTGDATPGAPDSDTGERTGSGTLNTSGQAVNDLSASDSATVTADKPSLAKVVADDSLQIGEVTTATITISVPVGQTDNFVLQDTLPAGLRYTGTAISITLPPSNFSASNSPSTTPGADTNPLAFDFGTVVNSAATSQDIVISYEVQVENVIGNQRNTALTNDAQLTYTGAAAPATADATITVREPALALAKTITAGTPAVAGDEVSYQLTVSNTDSLATAYRMDLTDVLPADLLGANGGSGPYFTDVQIVNPGDAVLKSAGGALSATDADQTTATDTLAWPAFDLPPSTTLTITYKATVVADAVTGSVLTNAVAAEYNSLPSGTDGRDGSDVLDDTDNGQLNNYGQTTSRDLTLDANIALQKTLTTGQPDANFAIGEEVLFDVQVSLLAGVTGNVVVTDTLPAGLEFIELVGINAETGISYDGSGTAVEDPTGTVTVTLGDVTIAPTVVEKSLTLQLMTQVRNVTANQNGEVLTNTAAVASDIGPASDTLDVTVVEPVLQVTKTPDTTVPALGNEVTYTVEVSHAAESTADAYQVILTDLIPTGLSYVVGSTTGATVDETNEAAPVFSFAQIAEGASATFSYRATVDLDAVVGSALENQINGTFASTADADGAEDSGRDGSDGAGGLNDYLFGTTAEVTPATTGSLYPVKTVALVVDNGTTGQVDPGDTLEYTIEVTNEGADATGVVFTDTVPANTTYVASSLSTDVGTPDDTGAPDLQVDIGNLAATATATISFQVTVDGGTPDGTVISNQGSVDSEQTVPTPTDADGVRDNGFQPTDIPVGGQPSLQSPLYAEKRVVLLTDQNGNGAVNPGDTLRYSLVASNNGDQALTNVSLTDSIPTGLTYVGGSANATAGTPTVNAGALSWTLPTLAAGDFEVLVFNVTVDDPLPGSVTDYSFSNQGATDSDQTQPGLTDGNGDPSDGFQPTDIGATTGAGAPALDVEKRWSLSDDLNSNGLANPGDTIAYRIGITNSGSAATVNARFTDAIPTGTTLVPGSVTTDIGAVTGTAPVAINLGSLLPGEVATVRFEVTIDGGVTGGTIIANQGTATGDNFADVLSDDNGNPADGRNPTQTPVVDGDDSVATPGGLTKTLIETSEAGSTGTNVLIGEVVTYQVGVQVPPGTLREALIEDVLPAGLGYLPGSAKLSRTFTTGLNAAQNPGDINAEPSGDFVDLIDDTELQQDGQTLSLLLGDVINSDGAAATYTLQYQAVVLNAAANLAGTTLDNQGTLRWLDALNQPASLTPVNQTLTVLEPALEITKVADPDVIALDGTTTFTLTVTHPSGANRATAYDLVLNDLFDDWASIDPGTITTTPSGGVADVDSSASTTSELNVTIGTFPVDGELVVTVEATNDGLPGDYINNTANLSWTSLPGEQGTNDVTPGDPGDADGERTGSGGTNNYADSASEQVRAVAVNFGKAIDNAQTRYAIGDVVDYRVTVTLPPDVDGLGKVVLENSGVTDVLDAGLVYVTGSLVATLQDGDITAVPALPADFTVSADTPQAGETTLTLDAGTLTNTNTTQARTLVLTYQARVADVAGNQDNQTLDNAAEFAFNLVGNPTEELDDTTQVQVGEPDITLAKTITSPTTGLDAGSAVDFQVVVTNDGTTTAYDTVLSDTLPTGLEDITSLQVTATSGGAPTPTFSTFTEGDDDFASDAFDLPAGGSVTLTFSATLSDDVQQGQQIQNQVLADYDSRSGVDPNGRDYSDNASSPIITVDVEVSFDKAFHPEPTATSYPIGAEFEYRLTLGIIEGLTRAVSIVDELPAGVSFIEATVGLGNTGMSTENSIAPNDQPTTVDGTNLTGETLTFDLGDVNNPGNGNPNDDTITIDIRVRVDNLVGNQAGTVLGNNAHALYTDAGDQAQRVDFDADAGSPGIQPLEATVVEPVLELDKTADRTSVAVGTEVVFTLDVAHAVGSDATAFDLVLVDTLPPGLAYVAGSASPAPTSVTGDSSTGQQLTFDLGSLTTAAGQTQVTFRALAEIDLIIDETVTNAASLTWASLPGATGEADNGRTGPLDGADTLNDYVSTSEADVTPSTDAFLYPVKTVTLSNDVAGNGQVDPGDTLTYSITLTNQGAITATDVVFTDPIPVNTSYVGSSLTSIPQGTPDDSADPLRVDIGDMAPGATVTIGFDVTVDAGVADGTIIANQGSVVSDQTVATPTDADGVRENGPQPTEIPVGPATEHALSVTKTATLTDDTVAPTGTINEGDEVTYQIVLRNTGADDLTNLAFSDTVPSGPSPAGMTVTAITSTQGTAPGATNAIVINDIGTLTPGDTVVITIVGTANGTGDVTNQAEVTSTELDPVLSDGDGDPTNGEQPTVFPVLAAGETGAPVLALDKRAELIGDSNGDGYVNPGETLRFVLTLRNTGSASAIDVQFSDTLDTSLGSLLPDSLAISQGVLLNLGPPLEINVGTLAPGAVETISYLVTADNLGLMQNVANIEDSEAQQAQASAQVPIVLPQAPIAEPVRNTVIGNRVWLDENGDGVQDAGEAGIGDVVVELYPAGAPPASDARSRRC